MRKFGFAKKILSLSLAAVLSLSSVNAVNAETVYGDEDIATSGDAEIIEDEENVEALSEFNYAKLLQYSLYFYDANMCGDDVSSKTLLDWRGNCHTYDKTTYKRKDGVTVNVNAVGGFHDAGDHVKFGITEAYAPFVLGMSYYTHKDAYVSAKQEGHLKTITNKFAAYLKNCMVLDASGNVEAYLVQVGMGGSGYDHGYWGAPESQPQKNRPFYFATASNDPSTDIVSLSAAALAMNYINFGDKTDLDAAKKLFTFAKNNTKATNKSGGSFYASSGWTDDYCLAALLLNKATGDSSYMTQYNSYKNDTKAANVYWPLCWDNTAPAVAYFANNGTLKNSLNVSGSKVDNVYISMNDWGSIRYNCGLQYEWILSGDYSKAETQMKYILGNNKNNRCYVTGYNATYSVKYPHHRAASGYSGSVQATKTQAHTLIGAIVGGPSTSGYFVDDATQYQYTEVGIDYNANLVAAAAALYLPKKNNSDQKIDPSYYSDDNQSKHPHIKGICQMPYAMIEPGQPGYLIGIETYTNPNNSFKYEMLILDCTTMQWVYTTTPCVTTGTCLWTVWQPQYGYYWTLFRIYDKDDNLIDEECYGFQNI